MQPLLRRTLLLGALALGSGSAAYAQQEICSEVFTPESLDSSLSMVDQALEQADLAVAKSQLKVLGKDLTCMSTPVPTQQLARFALQLGMTAFFEQDVVKAGLYVNLAMVTSHGEPPWPAWLPETHPFRMLVDEIETPPLGRLAGGFLQKKHAAVFVNGELRLLPEAYADLPALVQLFDSKGTFVQAFWQDGTAYPGLVLDPNGGKSIIPKWYMGEAPVVLPEDQVVMIDPSSTQSSEAETLKGSAARNNGGGSSFPVVPVIAGGGLAVLSGTLYALAGVSRGGLGDASSEDDLRAVRSRTNMLATTAGLAAVGAVGVGVTGVLLSGNGVVIVGRF